MQQFLEEIFLHVVRLFYTLPSLVGIFTLGVATVVLFIIQFQKQKETYLYGLIALGLGYLELAGLDLHRCP